MAVDHPVGMIKKFVDKQNNLILFSIKRCLARYWTGQARGMYVVVIDMTLGLPTGIPKVHIVTLSNLIPCLLLDVFVKIGNATEQKRLKSFVFDGCGLEALLSFWTAFTVQSLVLGISQGSGVGPIV